MQSIRKRLSILFAISSLIAILLTILFVNITINNKFNKYMLDIQNKRNERIVSYFEEVYKRDNMWKEDSGIELMHEAYMGNYCLTLRDTNGNVIWGMDPSNIIDSSHLSNMNVENKGVYVNKKFDVIVDGSTVGYVELGQYSSILLTEEDIEFKSSINRSIILSGIGTLGIVILISLYLSNELSIPIRKIAKTSKRLSNGNFNAKSYYESDIEEIEELRDNINILGEKLRYQDMLRKRLVSDISHEIRTPLNVLQNNLEAMIDGIFPVNNQRLVSLNEEVIRFGKLLNNLDTLKEFEDESICIDFENIILDEFIMEIVHEFSLEAKSKNINFECTIDKEESYLIYGDRDKLKQVFINLISNSIKFTNSNGYINLYLYKNNESTIVEIKDNGIGIKQEDLPFIFERLYRGDKSRQSIEGNGIGLTIVKKILNLHYASIDVESEEGVGTSFKINFNNTKA
ncbi:MULTISPECIES: HAMP domain-containing sensor histidine kinase [Clostridium]|uniref:histidine kinase n=1 Tax=Clostridium sartagoforme AAU1 TaxID=1202534 RepID=R9CF71_9CLOT|nr:MULTISPECIES: HAMP domain-containing sensor histidine kinase [Clostridium]EOR27685.1 sensor histidine kinase [Clostridium sartagoforme AAU1]KLE15793.1 histidine kinase [Clostridium sp. C8]